MTGIHLLRLTVIMSRGRRRVTGDGGIGGFSHRIAGIGWFPGWSVLCLTLPHIELSPLLLSYFQNQRRPGGADAHQISQSGLRLANQVIVGAVVVIKDCDSDG